MKKTRLRFRSSDGENIIYGFRWEPEGQPKAVLQIIHGMSEHIDRYDEFAEFIADHGIAVYGMDLPGHGLSVRDPDDLGWFAEKDGKGLLLTDVHSLTKLARKEHPGLPIFLLGHSMGSFIARRYLTIWGDELAGALILGTGSHPLGMTIFAKGLAYLYMKAFGPRYRSKLLDLITIRVNDIWCWMKGMDNWFSKNAESVAAYRADPRCGFAFTAEGYHTLFSLLQDLASNKNADRIPKDLPVVFASGMDDPVGSCMTEVLSAYNKYVRLGIQDLDVWFYQGDRHEILNELDREDVYSDILDWIEERI